MIRKLETGTLVSANDEAPNVPNNLRPLDKPAEARAQDAKKAAFRKA